MFETALLIVIAIAAGGYLLTRRAVTTTAVRSDIRFHSLPSYYATFVALWVGIPSILLALVWVALQEPILDRLIVATVSDELLQQIGSGRADLLLSKIKSLLGGQVFGTPDPAVVAAAEQYQQWRAAGNWLMLGAVSGVAAIAAVATYRKVSPEFRARQRVERIANVIMIVCAILAILTTLGIVLSLLFEALRFFDRVPWYEFFFGTNWEPQIPLREGQVAGEGAFGAIPVFTGTLLIAGLAMLVAAPIGLFSAIYLSEYAGQRFRDTVKPLMEILAGIPTVVYGFFAVLVVAPALRQFGAGLGLDVAPNSAIAAGGVMGIMIIPFVSSLSDDAIRAVPQTMRDGAYGLGATKAETITTVLLPAALPGIVGGMLLATSRAIGETMIVVMAAGLIASLTANPFEAVTTVTVQIITLLIGDTSFDNPKTLAAFALGLVLFVVTLALNAAALRVVQKYRERYE